VTTQQGGPEICADLCPTITSAAGMSGNNQNYGNHRENDNNSYSKPSKKSAGRSTIFWCVCREKNNRKEENGFNKPFSCVIWSF